MKTIGWIGLGLMGVPMARRLLEAGYELHVHNRTRDKAAELLDQGAHWVDTPKELARRCDVLMLMVSDADAVAQILEGADGALAGIASGSYVIDMSTIGPDQATSFAESVRARGGSYLEARVTGSVLQAREGSLLILGGGNRDAFESCEPIFSVLGRKSFYFGEIGTGSVAKLSVNLLLGLTVQAVSEMLVFAERAGINRELLFELILESPLASRLLQVKKDAFLQEQFPAAFPLKHMNKDMALARNFAEQTGADLPAASASADVFARAMNDGLGELDLTAVLLQIKQASS